MNNQMASVSQTSLRANEPSRVMTIGYQSAQALSTIGMWYHRA
jgi:hypothetical protein